MTSGRLGFDEAGEMIGDLRIGRLIGRGGRTDGADLAQGVDFDNVRGDRAATGLPDDACRKPDGEHQATERHKPPVARACARAEPIRSSQTWAARRYGVIA